MKPEVTIVGSGVGGATVAKELATRGVKVTILEQGRCYGSNAEAGRLASAWRLYRSYYTSLCGDLFARLQREILHQRSTVEIFRATMVGGSSMLSAANGVIALRKELEALRISLETEFEEVEKELGVSPFPERFYGERTRRLLEASEELGVHMNPMPKFIDFSKCTRCGNCAQGCPYDAKWTAERFIEQAVEAGAQLETETFVDRVLHSDGEVNGLQVHNSNGTSTREAENIVLAAGAIGTPMLLQKSGINNAGTNLFADLSITTYGTVEKEYMEEEMGAATMVDEFHERQGFILTPTYRPVFSFRPFWKKLRCAIRSGNGLVGLTTKITDEDAGKVDADGTIHKPVTRNDRRKLERGGKFAKEILSQAGADPSSFYTTRIRGNHPGGTAGIGRVLNPDQETEISRLFVSDASVLPKAPGAPPILTIIALSKRLAKKLVAEYL